MDVPVVRLTFVMRVSSALDPPRSNDGLRSYSHLRITAIISNRTARGRGS